MWHLLVSAILHTNGHPCIGSPLNLISIVCGLASSGVKWTRQRPPPNTWTWFGTSPSLIDISNWPSPYGLKISFLVKWSIYVSILLLCWYILKWQHVYIVYRLRCINFKLTRLSNNTTPGFSDADQCCIVNFVKHRRIR